MATSANKQCNLLFILTIVLHLPLLAFAHVRMATPVPFNIDADRAPLLPTGANFPCKGGMPSGTQPSTVLEGGKLFDFSIFGVYPHTAVHGGGSCQWSLSYDDGASWMVIHSYQGGCPAIKDPTGAEAQGWPISNYSVPMPANAPASDLALLSWTWVNLQGNREMYQDCAAVQIKSSGQGFQAPAMFEANIGNGCSTNVGFETIYPDPGKSVQFGNTFASGAKLPASEDTVKGCPKPKMLAVDASGKMVSSGPDIELQDVPAPRLPEASPTGPNTGGSNGDTLQPTAVNAKSTNMSAKKQKTEETTVVEEDSSSAATDTASLPQPTTGWVSKNFYMRCRAGSQTQPVSSRRLKRAFRHLMSSTLKVVSLRS